ncbi:DUF5677 domain-containing protein [Lysinibacillus sp. RS11]|uniref:DUF5677 domain-containing protein n=1 Tax=Lysinibacillus sp. RS11 TaxID=3242682 RepID=UPI0035C6C0FB
MAAEAVLQSGEELLDKLLKRFNGEKYLDFEDEVIIGLFSSIVKKSKSLIVLANEGSLIGTEAVMRSIFEARIYLIFILQKHTRERTKAYSLSAKIQIYKQTELMQKKLTAEAMKQLGVTIEELERAKPTDYDKIRNEYLELTKRFEKVRENKSKPGTFHEKTGDKTGEKWYKAGGDFNNFQDLCFELGYIAEYVIVFKTWSTEVHSRDAKRVFNFASQSDLDFSTEGIYSWIISFVGEASLMIAKKYNVPYTKIISKPNFIASQIQR